MISVIIPVRNGGADFARCLDAVNRQEADEPIEIVVVDSSSADGSPSLARRYGARVISIPVAEFNHGRARNLAAEAATGGFLVFTTQDAHAERSDWLRCLTQPLLAQPEVAGVYGRQLPHPGARPAERFFLDYVYGPEPRVQRARSREEVSMDTSMFSNVNSAIRRSEWERFRFADDLIGSEDHEWAVRALLAGRTIRYVPEAPVRHSHAYTVASAFRRFFDTGVSSEKTYLAGGRRATGVLRSRAFRYAREEVRWMLAEGEVKSLPYTAVYELAKYAGLMLGARHRLLPVAVKRRLSSLPGYWDRFGAERVN